MNITPRRAAATAILASATTLSLLAGATPASAKGDDRVERSGQCSGSARWELKVKSDDGGLEVEGEIDSDVSGQVWSWRIVHDGSAAARGTATTRGPSGSFSVERHLANHAGTDHVVFVASLNGQTCRGSVRY